MTSEVAKILAASLEPLRNKEIITTLSGLVKTVTQTTDAGTIRFPVPYDFNAVNYQIQNAALVPDQRQRAIVYFEGNDTNINLFEQRKTKASTSLRLVCWYDSSKIDAPNGGSVHVILASAMLTLIKGAKPKPNTIIAGLDIDATRIYDSADNLFSRYSYRQERVQYLQSPYFALGIDFTVTYQINHGCADALVPLNAQICC